VFWRWGFFFPIKGNPAGDLQKTVAPLYWLNLLVKLGFIRDALQKACSASPVKICYLAAPLQGAERMLWRFLEWRCKKRPY
jgi:hypothetical protein